MIIKMERIMIKKILFSLACGFFLAQGLNASAATYYVAKTSCSDSYAGTASQPWCTIGKAANTLVAGDTVYVKQGTYNESVSIANSGTAGNYITFAANPGDTVTMDASGLSLDFAGLFNIDSRSYIKISGFRLLNSSYFGIEVQDSDHITLEKNYIYRTFGSAIHVFDSNNILLDGNELNAIQTWTNPKSDDEEDVTFTAVNNFEIKNNYIHDCNRVGIDAKVGSAYGKIHDNVIKDTGLGPDNYDKGPCIYLDAGADYDKNPDGSSIPNYEHDIDIYNNIADHCTQGIIFATETATGKMENINFYNNLVYNNDTGMGTYGYPGASKKNINFVNNTVYGNNVGFYFPDSQLVNTVVRNNIISGNNNYQIYLEGTGGSYLTVDHNLVNGDSDMTGSSAIAGDPKFVNASAGNFHLQSTSPAIDKGSSTGAPAVDFDGKTRPQGAGWDIGAYELVSTACAPTTCAAQGAACGTISDAAATRSPAAPAPAVPLARPTSVWQTR